MVIVTKANAAATCEAYDWAGELTTVVELRQRFRDITDNEQARACVCSIIGWQAPLPHQPRASKLVTTA